MTVRPAVMITSYISRPAKTGGSSLKDPGDNTLAVDRTKRASQSTVGFGDAELGVFG